MGAECQFLHHPAVRGNDGRAPALAIVTDITDAKESGRGVADIGSAAVQPGTVFETKYDEPSQSLGTHRSTKEDGKYNATPRPVRIPTPHLIERPDDQFNRLFRERYGVEPPLPPSQDAALPAPEPDPEPPTPRLRGRFRAGDGGWSFSITPKEKTWLESNSIADRSDPALPPSVLPLPLLVFLARTCRALGLWWLENPFNDDEPERRTDGVLSLGMVDCPHGVTVTHTFGCYDASDVAVVGQMRVYPMLDDVLVSYNERDFRVPIVEGPVVQVLGVFGVVGPGDEVIFERSSHAPLHQANTTARTMWESGVHQQWLFPQVELLEFRGRLLVHETGKKNSFTIPESYIAKATSHFVARPARNPANFSACVDNLMAHARAAVSTSQALTMEPILVLAAAVVAYRSIELTADLFSAAFSPSYDAFNRMLLGSVTVVDKWVLFGLTLVVWAIAGAAAFVWGGELHGLIVLGVLVLPPVFGAYFGISFRRGPGKNWLVKPRLVDSVRRMMSQQPCMPGDHYQVGDRVYSCLLFGHLRIPRSDAVYAQMRLPNRTNLNPVLRVVNGIDQLAAARRSTHLCRVGVTSHTIPTVHCTQPAVVFSALCRFMNEVSTPAGPPPGFLEWVDQLVGLWDDGMKLAVRALAFKPSEERWRAWWEVYRQHPNKTRLAYVWNTLFKNENGVRPYDEYQVDDPHLFETEFFGKLEVASRMRGIESVHPFLLVVLGVAEYEMRPHIYRMYRSLRGWEEPFHRRLYWAPGSTRAELATWGWVYRHYCIVTYDYSRWDSKVPKWQQDSFHRMFRSDDPEFNALMLSATRRRLSMRFNRQKLLSLEFSGKQMTGSPMTTFGNTTNHWNAMSWALTELGWAPRVQSVLIGGDDGAFAVDFEFTKDHADLLVSFLLEAFGYIMDPVHYGAITTVDFFSSRWVPTAVDGVPGYAFVPKCGRMLTKLGWAIDVKPGEEMATYKAKLLSARHDSSGCPLCQPLLDKWLSHPQLNNIRAASVKEEEHRPAPDLRKHELCGASVWGKWYPGETLAILLQSDDPFGCYNFDGLARVDYGKDSFMGTDNPPPPGTHFPVTLDDTVKDYPAMATTVPYSQASGLLPYREYKEYVADHVISIKQLLTRMVVGAPRQ